ncbi:amino acid adenylation domain-containing protein [Coleofasciculus sp. H7-2]|uniref:non-ribosomal peptide synthetase n=1 Tax=Coleofasciculus sp. H7-2 TaxID=3351545 RepID=UPI00366D78C7
MSEITQRIAQLSPAKRALLEQKLQEKSAKSNAKQSISKRTSENSASLSFSQERMWLLDQFEPENPAYNRPSNIHLVGRLNVAALEQSLNEIVRRHEIFRTSFPIVDGQPIQAIVPALTLTLPLVDLSHLPTSERDAEVQRLAIQAAQHKFKLSQLPLIQATLLRLGEEEHILLLTLHHIIFDGWSMGVLLKELAALYNAFITEKPSPLPELPIQYADFAAWQRQQLQGEKLTERLTYWKQQLAGELPILKLPADRPRFGVRTVQGARELLLLPKTQSQALKALSQHEGVTLFTTLLAAFQTLLYRYTGQADIVVGSHTAGRDRAEIEKLIGNFINTLALRTQIESQLTFQQLLSRVRETIVGAYVHQDIPFEKLVEELQPKRDLSHTPLFQVFFQFRNLPSEAVELQGLKMDNCQLETGFAQIDLSLEITEQYEGLSCLFQYDTDLFEAATIKRMASHFQTLLEGIISNSQQHLWEIPLLTQTERHQLLIEWNDTQMEYAKQTCIHQLFQEQVKRTPDAVAVVFEDKQLTYQELNARANQLARYLQRLGVKPEGLVSIFLERSLEMIIGVLGVLKAGGAYVPLDPAYPQERIAYMLEDSQVPVLLTQQGLTIKRLVPSIQVVYIDAQKEVISQESESNLDSGVTANNLAYIIYTSGSTGNPKGVQLAHFNVVNLLSAIQQQLQPTSQDTWLAVTTISFDVSVAEIFLPLAVGAKLAIVRREVTLDGVQLSQAINKFQATFMQGAPATWQLLLASGWQGSPHLTMISTGEALPRELAHQLLDKGKVLWNLYGPTETTIWSSSYQVKNTKEPISIGRPLTNTQFYILDSNQQLVPIGVPGELHIGGEGLARSYLNRPELTEEKFMIAPFKPNTRLYKTGDLARYLPDGRVDCIGRIDNQVKIRGFRIELGEIEATLSQHPAVQTVAIVVREVVSGDKRLIAYFVSNQQENFETLVTNLRNFLKDKLPTYMVPSAFIKLDSLPLTPSGKIDRRALPIPDFSRQESTENFVAPKDDLELRLAKIWEKVLGISSISIQDNFFDLGGHSLLAVQLFSQIKKNLGQDIPVAILFQAPTIEELACILRQEGWSNRWSSLVPVKPGGSQVPFFFHGGAADAITWAKFSHLLPSDRPFYGLQHPILEGKVVFQNSVEEMAAHCLKEIRTIQPNGPYFIGGHCFGGTVAFEMAQQLHAQGEKIALLALIDAYAPKPLPKNNLLWRTQALFRKSSFLLNKTYYYHAENLKQRNVWGKFIYLSDWLKEKVQAQFQQKLSQKRLELNSSSPKNNSILDSNAHSRKPNDPISHELRYLEAEKANRAAKARYTPQIYPGSITLFRAKTQLLEWYFGSELGWESFTEKKVESYEISGIFGNLFNQSSLPLLVERVKLALEKVQENQS